MASADLPVVGESQLPRGLAHLALAPGQLAFTDGDDLLGRVGDHRVGQKLLQSLVTDRIAHQGVFVLAVLAGNLFPKVLGILVESLVGRFVRLADPPGELGGESIVKGEPGAQRASERPDRRGGTQSQRRRWLQGRQGVLLGFGTDLVFSCGFRRGSLLFSRQAASSLLEPLAKLLDLVGYLGQPRGSLFRHPPESSRQRACSSAWISLAKRDQLGHFGQAAAIPGMIVELGAELGAEQQVVNPAVLIERIKLQRRRVLPANRAASRSIRSKQAGAPGQVVEP